MNTLLAGKTCLVTGANSGIGKALSLALAGYGARVVMACRDRLRGQNTVSEIKRKTGNPNVELLLMDLCSWNSIRNGVLGFKEKYTRLDVLINNAGVLLFKKKITEDGVEAALATNYLGPFFLTNLLLELLIASAPSRIINVVSEGLSKKPFQINNLFARGTYKPLTAYTQSKQAEILFTFELASRLRGTGVTANCFYPGLVKTNLGKAQRGFHRFTYFLLTGLLGFLFSPMEEGIKPGIFLAAAKKGGSLTGRFLKRRKNKIIATSAYNKEVARRLWAETEKITDSFPLARPRGEYGSH